MDGKSSRLSGIVTHLIVASVTLIAAFRMLMCSLDAPILLQLASLVLGVTGAAFAPRIFGRWPVANLVLWVPVSGVLAGALLLLPDAFEMDVGQKVCAAAGELGNFWLIASAYLWSAVRLSLTRQKFIVPQLVGCMLAALATCVSVISYL